MTVALAILIFVFVFLALSFTAMAFVFKMRTLCVVSGGAWLTLMMFLYYNTDLMESMPILLLCLTMMLVMFSSAVWLPPKIEPEVKKKYSDQEIDEMLDDYRNKRARIPR